MRAQQARASLIAQEQRMGLPSKAGTRHYTRSTPVADSHSAEHSYQGWARTCRRCGCCSGPGAAAA